MQMSSLELCNWLVISLLSFFVCGKDSDGCAAQRDLEQVVFGIYSINAEGGDATTTPVDVGIVIEGVEVLHDLGDIASACALLMGVIYAMNLSYPQELKMFFEVLQKIFLQLDATRVSTKVQMLKNKLYEWTNIERVAFNTKACFALETI